MTPTDDELDDFIRALLGPDPVDAYQDRMANKRGLFRHPDLPIQSWRRLRVEFLNRYSTDYR